MIEIREECVKFNTSQRLAGRVRMITREGCLCDLKILETYQQINGEIYQ